MFALQNGKLLISVNITSLFSWLLVISPIKWQRVLEDSRVMDERLLENIATDGYTKESSIGAYLFSKTIVRLVSNFLFTVLYFKQCASSLLIPTGEFDLRDHLYRVREVKVPSDHFSVSYKQWYTGGNACIKQTTMHRCLFNVVFTITVV